MWQCNSNSIALLFVPFIILLSGASKPQLQENLLSSEWFRTEHSVYRGAQMMLERVLYVKRQNQKEKILLGESSHPVAFLLLMLVIPCKPICSFCTAFCWSQDFCSMSPFTTGTSSAAPRQEWCWWFSLWWRDWNVQAPGKASVMTVQESLCDLPLTGQL